MAGTSRPCPYCGNELEVLIDSEEAADVRCPRCENVIRLSAPTQIPPEKTSKEEGDNLAANELMREGLSLAKEGRNEAAIIKLRAAAEKSPSRIDILMALAAACSRKKLAYEALSAFRKALDIEPDNREALFKAGMLLTQQGRFDQGITLLSRLVEIEPGNEQARLMINIATMRKEEAAQAASLGSFADMDAVRPHAGVAEILLELVKRAGGLSWAAFSGWILAPVAFAAAYGYWGASPDAMKTLLFVMLLYTVLMGVVAHELGHGIAALALGDKTALRAGRLTLNPLKHFSLIGTVAVPAVVYAMFGFMFGWAKPVPFNPLKLERQPRDLVAVAGTGPAASFTLSYLMYSMFLALAAWHGAPGYDTALTFTVELAAPFEVGDGIFAPFWFVALELTAMGALVNLLLGVFNLIPIPPLDGGWLLNATAPPSIAIGLQRGRWAGVAVIIALIYFGWIAYLFYPAYIVITGYYFLSGLIL